MGTVSIKKREYKGWKNCIEMNNEIVELIATTDVGPRIISFKFLDGENMFCEFEEQVGTTNSEEWNIYGGHRLWHSPEAKPRTYELDNTKIKWRKKKNSIILTQPIEPLTNIKKEIEIIIDADNAKVTITHRLTNAGPWMIELSVWAITVMAAGGREIVPQTTKNTELLPNRMLSLWPYTKLNDNRVTWGDKYIFLDQDVKAAGPFKFGMPNEDGWAAYINKGCAFLKQYKHIDNVEYPDYSASSYETYTNERMLEMETLSPLVILDTEETIDHTEIWTLYKDVKTPKNEKDVDRDILPLVKPVFGK